MDSGSNQIKRILNILKERGIFLCLIITIAFMVIGYLYSYYYVVPKYQAKETLLLIPNSTQEQQTITSTDLTLNSELISTYSSIAKQSKVLKQVIQNLNLDMTEEELLQKLQINNITDTYIIEIVVSDTDAQRTVEIAQELSNVFLQEIKQIYNLENIGIVDTAELPEEPYNINHIKDIVIFAMAGILVSGIIIIGIYLLDDTVKTEEDIEEYVNLKTLGKIPVNQEKEEIITNHDGKSYITECINTIRTNILYMSSTKKAKTILITSCNAQEGKSFVSTNIAASFAETNKKVLIIDADMRKGRIEKVFNVSSEEGLSNYLYYMTGDDTKDLELAKTYIKETQIANLHILTKGTIPPNPSELLNSNNMKRLINILKNVYDMIIIDSPPCKVVTDSIILSTIVDSVILVTNAEHTKIADIIETKKSIKMVNGNLIGVVLNNIKIKGKTYSKNYYYGHAKQEDLCEAVERKSYTVKELIDAKLTRLEIMGYEKLETIEKQEAKTENKEKIISSPVEKNHNETYQSNKIEQFIFAQNECLEKMISAILDIKLQLNKSEEMNKTEIDILSNKIKNMNYQEEINELSNKIDNMNYKEEIDALSYRIENMDYKKEIDVLSKKIEDMNYIDELGAISYELENLKKNFAQINNKEELEERVEEIYSEIEAIKERHGQLLDEIKDTKNMDSIIEEINKNKLTKQQVEEAINQAILNQADIEDIVSKKTLSRSEVEDIVKQESISIADIESIVRQALTSIDYTKQFAQMENMITELKNNYLELTNKINIEQQTELERKETEKVVDINSFKKEKRLKKREYYLDEDIPYSDLEEMAYCIIPFSHNNSSEDYQEKIAIK